MVATGTAVTLIVITLLTLVALTLATLYYLPPVLRPIEDEAQHH